MGWAVIVRGLPLGITSDVVQQGIQEALGKPPIFGQQPNISGDEALLYLPARDIQSKLTSKNITVRCGGTVVNVEKANIEQVSQWLLTRKPVLTNGSTATGDHQR